MTDDFVPYASKSHTYWTGFYTSRAALKHFVRRSSNFLQALRQLVSFTNLNDNQTIAKINALERAMGVVQHHDAVSGTENQHVANDYSKRLASAILKSVDIVPSILGGVLKTNESLSPVYFCPLLNISECLPIENSNSIRVIIYNPLANELNSWVRIPLVTNDYVIKDVNNKSVAFDVVSISSEVKSIPERSSKANYELVFNAENLPGLGFRVYLLEKTTTKQKKLPKVVKGNYKN